MSNILKFDWQDSKRKFFTSANTIFGRLGSCAPSATLLQICDTQCVPSFTYGFVATALSKNECRSLSYVYNSMYAKIFNTSNYQTIVNCQYYTGHLNFERFYDLNRLLFLNKLNKTNQLSQSSKVDEPDFRDFTFLKNKYCIQALDSDITIKHKVWLDFSNYLSI